jgi:hypothetical protein
MPRGAAMFVVVMNIDEVYWNCFSDRNGYWVCRCVEEV